MITANTLTAGNPFYNDLALVKELVYDKCGFDLTDLKIISESAAYGACSFRLAGKTIQFRISKITPTKSGQFVTIWKRNKNGITEAFDITDDLDFIIITSKSGDNFGQFIFPKSVLAEKGILTRNGKGGKRGLRVYPPWEVLLNQQAEKTKAWQVTYFLSIKNNNSVNLDQAKELFGITNGLINEEKTKRGCLLA